MKFFLEFVSCCGTAGRTNYVITAAAVKPAEDHRRLQVLLYGGPCTVPMVESCSRPKHRRTTVSRSGSSGGYSWRPALNAISEDRVLDLVSAVVDVDSRAANYGSGGLGQKKQKVANVSPRKIQAPHQGLDDFMRRAAPFGATVPTFSPTPFFF